jgi:anti-sigma factor RsiW
MMPAMCDERERLIGYVYDDCDPAERGAIEAHLEDCGTCRTEISALRRVRQDLLAWDVPPHQPVWRPLVETPVLPWYRQVPAWAMAAAAGVMFLVGAAGGVVTHALVPHPQPATAAANAPASIQAVPASITETQLTEVEQRMLQMMRDELGKRVAAARAADVPMVVSASRSALTPVQLNEMLGESEQRQLNRLSTVYSDLITQISMVRKDFGVLRDTVANQVISGNGGGR